ncbi:acyltransferase [Actinoplanes sp. NPDC089786]|uniref:acyltransferase family protein n=1 Tax=Actinoplanes sp. NPDC089786 TaxID=3155185 RepID=UPI00344330C2
MTTTDLHPVTAGRDHSIDVVRAIAVVGVVGGHWLVTGLVIGDGGAWHQASPLRAMPGLAPVSWFFQTLALLFFAGGFGAGRRRDPGSGAGRRSRPGPFALSAYRQHHSEAAPRRRGALRKLALPVAVLLAGWAVVLLVATLADVPWGTRRTIAMLVISPLWFLLPYLALRAVTQPLARAVDRVGPLPLVAPGIALVALSDAGLAPLWLAVPAAWSVPWILGIAVARRGRSSLPARTLIVAGVAAMAALVLILDYPASAVGVPGDGRSNLSPPSLFAVALGLAQIGLYLIIAGRAGRLDRGSPNGVVRSLNRAALPIYLGHQSVLVATTGVAALIAGGPVDGLLSAPTGPHWIITRLAWLPFLALVLAGLIRVAWPTTRRSRGGLVRD